MPRGVAWSRSMVVAGAALATVACREVTTPADVGEAVAIVANCPPAPSDMTGVQLTADVVYSVIDGQTLRLDVARPAGTGTRPLVVLLHGGGWAFGSRADLRRDLLDLAARGYVAASVSYRLADAPRNVFPAAVQDVRCAVRWLRAHAAEYGIDTAHVAAAGFSAGGHLASMLGAAADVPELEGGCATGGISPRVAAVVSYAGPQDLRVNGPYTQEQAQLVTNFLGAFPGDVPQVAALASPIVHASRADAPTLFVHGARDGLVPIEQSRRARSALRDAGTRATLLELRDDGHAFAGFGSSGRDEVRCTTMAFLDRWLGR